MELSDEEIEDILERVEFFLRKEDIRFVAVDVDAYKEPSSYIDWSRSESYPPG